MSIDATALAALTALRHRPRRILAVFAHPDDETYGVAGSLSRAAACDDTATALLCLTSGEASSVYKSQGMSRAEIAAMRENRMHQVAEVLDVDALLLPGLPDGGLAALPFDELSAPVRAAVDAFDPHVVIAHDPRGVNGHPDHIASHWAVRDALRGRDTRFAMVCYPPEVAEQAKPRLLFPTSRERIDALVELSDAEIEAKERCLQIHDALITLRPNDDDKVHVRPAVEHYDFLGETFSPAVSDLFDQLDGANA